MSYKEIIEACKKDGFSPKSSYIAHIKSLHKKLKYQSSQRKGDYKHPCPEHLRPKMEKIMKKLGVI